jgi:hypothetical protein
VFVFVFGLGSKIPPKFNFCFPKLEGFGENEREAFQNFIKPTKLFQYILEFQYLFENVKLAYRN